MTPPEAQRLKTCAAKHYSLLPRVEQPTGKSLLILLDRVPGTPLAELVDHFRARGNRFDFDVWYVIPFSVSHFVSEPVCSFR
jgi:hypothetical protein